MADIQISLEHLDEVQKILAGIPGGTKLVLEQSILTALRKGKSVAKAAVKARYAGVPPAWLTKALGTPRLAGPLQGLLRVASAPLPLGQIRGIEDIRPLGVVSPVLLDRAPLSLIHAFMRSGKVLERTSPSRTPLRQLYSASAPQMVGEKSEVYPRLEFEISYSLYSEMQRLLPLVLEGTVRPRAW
jgi:hypothetical protein